MRACGGVVALLLASAAALGAQEEHRSQRHHVHPNHVGVSVGGTSQLGEGGHTYATLGVDYVRRFGARGEWGLGGFGEGIFHTPAEWVLGAAGYVFPVRSLWLQVGGGAEFFEEEAGTGGTRASFLLRVGTGYQIGLQGFSLTPLVLVDLVRGTNAFVWGVSVGRGF